MILLNGWSFDGHRFVVKTSVQGRFLFPYQLCISIFLADRKQKVPKCLENQIAENGTFVKEKARFL